MARTERLGRLLHVAGVVLAFIAIIDGVVTIAGPDQMRPRVVALALAALSVIACVAGWRWFGTMGRVDAVLALAADGWVLFDVGW